MRALEACAWIGLALGASQADPVLEWAPTVGEPLLGVEKAWQRLRREAGLDDVRLHDLRHSYASVGIGVGLGLPPIGALLGHRQPSTTARYAHIADTVRRRSAEMIDEKLRAALGRASGS